MIMVRFQLAAVGGETRTNIRKNKYHEKCNMKYNEKCDDKYFEKYKKKEIDQI